MTALPRPRSSAPIAGVLVCLLGDFRILKEGSPLSLRPGGKVERLVGSLALQAPRGVPRDELLEQVWPGGDPTLAAQSLNSLAYWLSRHLRDALAGNSPILRDGGRYLLNIAGGVRVDVVEFEAAIDAGRASGSEGEIDVAIGWYRDALAFYTGDLGGGSDIIQLLERERLRAKYLTTLSRLADHYFAIGDYERALQCALELLRADPCREDAHRVAMCCYVRSGERAQALRQYRICRRMLAIEFDTAPEPSTEALYELARTEPQRI